MNRNVPVLSKLADSGIQVIPQNVSQTLGGLFTGLFWEENIIFAMGWQWTYRIGPLTGPLSIPWLVDNHYVVTLLLLSGEQVNWSYWWPTNWAIRFWGIFNRRLLLPAFPAGLTITSCRRHSSPCQIKHLSEIWRHSTSFQFTCHTPLKSVVLKLLHWLWRSAWLPCLSDLTPFDFYL
jgi:hypothetical protein